MNTRVLTLPLVSVLLGALASACGDGEPKRDARDGGASEDAAGPAIASSCTAKDDGVVCGDGRFCVDHACRAGVCGDGVVTGTEACDDGNKRLGDGCDPSCQVELASCGNAKRDEGEECDDGNRVDGDACSNACLERRCGNGRIDHAEECDDGNADNGDECSKDCALITCRNGRLDPGEECDDGNATDRGDGCTNACKVSVCGNGKLEKYEDCDDGNRIDADVCPSDCKQGVCGNGVVEAGEVCETGRILRGSPNARYQGCAANCKGWLSQEADECLKCQQDMLKGCNNYQDFPFYDGCLVAYNPLVGPAATQTPESAFPGLCADLMECALTHGCWTDPTLGATGCYCGSAKGDDCSSVGPAPDSPCLRQFQAASGSVNNNDVNARFSDFTYPSAWAFYLLECMRTQASGNGCAHVCSPPKKAP